MRKLFQLKPILSFVYLKDPLRCTASLQSHVQAVCGRIATKGEIEALQEMLDLAKNPAAPTHVDSPNIISGQL
jgi:hypothetical protein